MVQEVIPPKIELSQQEISQRLVQFYGTTLLGLIFQSDQNYHQIVAYDVSGPKFSRTSFDIKSIGGKPFDEGRKATVIGKDATNGVVSFATPRGGTDDPLFASITIGVPTLGDTVQLVASGGFLTSQIVDNTYQNWIPACHGSQLIQSIANPLPARLLHTWNPSLNGAFAINPTTGAFLGIVSGMDPATRSAVMTKAISFEVSNVKVRKALDEFLEANPGVSLETIIADRDLYPKLRQATYVRPKHLGMGTCYDASSGGYIIYSIATVVIDGALAERAEFNATETEFRSSANQERELLEDYALNKSYGYGAIVSLEYTDAITRKTVIARAGDLDFGVALDRAALRAKGSLKIAVKWEKKRELEDEILEKEPDSYTLDLDTPVKESVAGVALKRNLSELTYLATANQISQFVALQPGTAIDSLDLFKANDFDNLCHPPGPCGGGYYPYQVVAIRPYYHPTAADFASAPGKRYYLPTAAYFGIATYSGDYRRKIPAYDVNTGAYLGGSVVNFNGSGCCS